MIPFALSVFLSAFLLFQIQPMVGKFILPRFGGTPAVWSTVILFFQALLTGGYVYAYWLIRRVTARRQPVIHLTLITFTVFMLGLLAFIHSSPIMPDSNWQPDDGGAPILDIFELLLVSVGLPYLLLASNGPLMQAWYSQVFPKQSYARLYSLSNAGSLLGLLTYPVLIEPTFSLRWQGWIWTGGFTLFGMIASWVGVRSRRAALHAQPKPDSAKQTVSPPLPLLSLWIMLSATASVFLLSVTNQISQEVAVIPFLWVLPLTLYLLSFILTFAGKRAYDRKIYTALFILSTALTLFVMFNVTALHIFWQISAYSLTLFAACMICHGELYRLRPPAENLTVFYLMISIGGMLGGIFVNLIAPALFNGYWEFFVALTMTIAILLSLWRVERAPLAVNDEIRSFAGQDYKDIIAPVRFVFTSFVLVVILLAVLSHFFSGALYAKRNFYGVIRVREELVGNPPRPAYLMVHGITVHGLQFVDAVVRDLPTAYYVEQSGAALAILNHPRYAQGLRVGLLGVGTGTLAIYGQPGDVYRLYEINPIVVELAEGQGGYFSFVRHSKAEVDLVLGDARISLDRELAEGNRQNFNVLVLDTFSSDSIPVHLVTKEAFALYLEHLAPDGIIAAHITNRHLDLQPVFWQLAQYYGLRIVSVIYAGDSNGGYESHWLLLSRDPALLEIPAIRERAVDLREYSTGIELWTDDYSNLFQILK